MDFEKGKKRFEQRRKMMDNLLYLRKIAQIWKDFCDFIRFQLLHQKLDLKNKNYERKKQARILRSKKRWSHGFGRKKRSAA